MTQQTPVPEEPEDLTITCEAELAKAIAAVHTTVDPGYVVAVAGRICYWTSVRKQNPYDIAAIISQETSFIPQLKCGRFGCGAMQVIGVHARKRGLPKTALLDLNTNIDLGTEIWKNSGYDYNDYNGHATPGYAQEVRRWRRLLEAAGK